MALWSPLAPNGEPSNPSVLGRHRVVRMTNGSRSKLLAKLGTRLPLYEQPDFLSEDRLGIFENSNE